MIQDLRRQLNLLLDRHRSLEMVVQRESQGLIQSVELLSNCEEAGKILQAVAVKVQQDAHQGIAAVVSRCLETIFDEPYRFELQFEQKRGKTEAQLTLLRGDLTFVDPLHEVGGGVIDVAAFALRLACLVLERPPKRRVLILDEPFGNLRGQHHRRKMRALVQALAEDFQVQFIINIDHDQFPEFLDCKVIEFS